MKVLGRGILEEFSEEHRDARQPLLAWVEEAKGANWQKPQDVKNRYPSVSFVAGGKTVFNIKGNRYRLLVQIAYETQIVQIMRLGTHAQYDKWDL
ncbi:MAG: type II toxin-antitoxin system HigB family toxin [Acidobacteriota bacterium]